MVTSGTFGNVFTGAKILGLLLVVAGLFAAAPPNLAVTASSIIAFFSALLSIFLAYDG